MTDHKKILIAPLNWGLGHATRCMPIIDELLLQGAEVILASDGRAAQLLEKEYPQLAVEYLPAYDITYKTSNMMFNIATQLPKILKAIYQEKKVVQELVEKHNIDIIISDNRYGVYSEKTKNIFLTHQLNIKIPLSILEAIVKQINYSLIKKFDCCWIPDVPNEPNIAGSLSHGFKLNNLKYLGSLSRMSYKKVEEKYDAIIILSGPEPQRTYLEKELIQQASQLHASILIVKGKTNEDEMIDLNERVRIVSYMKAKELNEAILASRVVISRSGYSTIMDLVALKKKAILIPTPGQTEQEYLANKFYEQKIFYTQSQGEIDLSKALIRVEDFTGFNADAYEQVSLKNIISSLLLDNEV